MTVKQPNSLPNWLQQPNHLTSQPQRHNFLAHNQQHLTQLLSRLAQPLPAVKATRWQLSPATSLIRLGILVLLIALTNNTAWLWVLGLLLAGHLLVLTPSQLRRFTRSWLLSTGIALLVVLPSYWLVGPATVLLFVCKTGLILASTQYYRLTTTFQALLSGLKALHCPNLFIMTLAVAITYLRMLGHYLLQTMMALDYKGAFVLCSGATKKAPSGAFFRETYLLPGMLKRLLKRSTRPPVSTTRCLPVKNGWQLPHTSRFRS